MVYSKEIMKRLPRLCNTEVVIPDELSGFEIEKKSRDVSVSVRKGYERKTSHYITDRLSVRWDFAVVKCVIYKVPSVATKPYNTEGGLGIVSLEPLLMEALGIVPERIEMPEIVCLPIPSWVTRRNNCIPSAVVSHEDIESVYCLVREKQQMIAEYMDEVDSQMARFLAPAIDRDGLVLTDYGRAAMMRITRRWKGSEDGFNAGRLRKVIRKYVDLEFRKGGIYANRYMAENHGIDIVALEQIAPGYLEETPAELEREAEYDKRREQKELARMENQMLNADVLYSYHSLDMLQFGVNLFGNRLTPELAPLSPFFEGHFVSRKRLILYFQDAYSLEIEMESFSGDDLARIIACSWGLKNDGVLLKSGEFDDDSRKNPLAIAGKAMMASLEKVFVNCEDAGSYLDPVLESREALSIYKRYGPFILSDDKRDADHVFIRRQGALARLDAEP